MPATFITGGMRDLLRGTIERLAGKSSNAVFHLKQAMGGGKTHSMIALGLLATSWASSLLAVYLSYGLLVGLCRTPNDGKMQGRLL